MNTISLFPRVRDEYVRAVQWVHGVVHDSPNQLDIYADTLDFPIATGCDFRRGGGYNVLKWSIPYYFPSFRFEDMELYETKPTEHPNIYHEIWTATSAETGELWQFRFFTDYDGDMQEYNVTLMYARLLAPPAHEDAGVSYLIGV
jgi:hypothetical protein